MGYNKTIQTFADIILNERFDIVALQEIKRQKAVDMILERLPSYWKGEADNEVNDYAFIWNTRRIRLVETQTSYGVRTYRPRIYKQYRVDRVSGQTDLVREPYFARFTPSGTIGGLPFEIRLINAHIRFGKLRFDEDETDENSLGAIAMRKNEFSVLAKTIYVKEADKRYGNNMPAYTILLGDFNLNMPSSNAGSPYLEEVIEISDDGKISKLVVTEQNKLTTLKSKYQNGTDESEELSFSNNYDHFTYDSNRFDSVNTKCEKIDSVQKYCGGDFKEHKEKVSDHVPIVMEIDLIK
jgi:endonuclease/exonuclease/phosphatase family metal-dependent hydrolase